MTYGFMAGLGWGMLVATLVSTCFRWRYERQVCRVNKELVGVLWCVLAVLQKLEE